MATEEETSYTDLVYQKLTSAEKRHYRGLNRRVRMMKIYFVLIMVAVMTVIYLMLQINVLIAVCVICLFIFALNSIVNEMVRSKVDRILFERGVGLDRHQVDRIRREYIQKPAK